MFCRWFLPSFAAATSLGFAPSVRAAEPLSFDDALHFIASRSIAVRQADESLGIARDRKELTDYQNLPSLGGNAKLMKSSDFYRTTLTTGSVGLTSELNLYRFGASEAHRKAAEAGEAQAELDRAAASDDDEARIAEALIDVVSLQKEAELAKAVLKSRLDNLDMAQRLYQRGLRPSQDVEKVRIDAANEESNLHDAELALANAETALVTFAGEPVSLRSDWPWRERFQVLGPNALPPADGKKAASERSDRRALVEKVRALEAAADEARANGRPSLDLDVSHDWMRVNPDYVYGRQWSGSLVLTVPLFDRRAADFNYREQLRIKALASLELEAKDRSLQGDFEVARAGFAAALTSAGAREKTLAAARSLYDRSLKSFQAGVLSANELSLDQDRLLQTELNALRGWTSAHRNFIKLCRARAQRLTPCLADIGRRP